MSEPFPYTVWAPQAAARPVAAGEPVALAAAHGTVAESMAFVPETPAESMVIGTEILAHGPMALFDVPTVAKTPKPKRNTRKPVNQAPKHSDHFQTPGSALWPLLPYLPAEATIWEPACGKRNLVRFLQGRGYDCFGTDLLEGHDFLTMPAPRSFDVIATNPPFSVKDLVISRCYELGKPFALLLPYTALEGQLRQSLYRKHGVQVLVMAKRVNFETPNNNGSSAWFPTLWLTWGLGLPSDLSFAAASPEADERAVSGTAVGQKGGE